MRIWMIVSSVMLASFCASEASAQLEVCNQTETKHSVSIGYKDGENWVSEGWWGVDPGDCSTVISQDLDLRYYYYHPSAKGHDYEGAYTFCVESNAYTIIGDTDCEKRGYRKERFLEADTGGNQTAWTIVLNGAPVSAPAPKAPPSPQASFPTGGGYYPYADYDTGAAPALSAWRRRIWASRNR